MEDCISITLNYLKDTFKHKGLRNKLVATLVSKGIANSAVLKAIGSIPRHMFMDSSFLDHAYQDKAFPIAANQTISQPYTVAFQSELLDVSPGDKVLEIGTGSGYQAAVLCLLGAHVYSIERQLELFKKTMHKFIKGDLTYKSYSYNYDVPCSYFGFS